MSQTIIKTYSGEQLYNMYRDYLLAKKVGLTDFNDGSKTKALIQAQADIISSVAMDFKEGIYRAIPIALYEGFGFKAKTASGATGYIRPYRKPVMLLTYNGTATATTVTITGTEISTTAIGSPADAFTLSFATYDTTAKLVAQINTLTHWTAVLIKDVQCSKLYQYANVDAKLKTNYLNVTGMDIMLATDIAVSIPAGYSVTVDSMPIITLVDATIPAGDSGVAISSKVQTPGTAGNIIGGALDTLNGDGIMNSVISGIEYAINDTAFSGGAAAETEAEQKVRFIQMVNSLNAGTLNGITVALMGITGVRSVDMIACSPYRGMNTIIVDDGSGTISATLLAALEQVLYGDPDNLTDFPGKNAEGIGYSFVPPTIQSVNIGVTVYRLASAKTSMDVLASDVKSAIEQCINTLPIGNDVILSEVVRVAKNSNASIYDIKVTTPSANITVASTNVARVGSGTSGIVTVTTAIITEA